MSYINPGPGTAAEVVLTLSTTVTGDLVVPALQDITVNNANDIFTWTQLDTTGKFNIPTTSTNGISGNIVVDEDTYFGDGVSTADSAAEMGIFGLSDQKVLVTFTLNFGSKTISGSGYVVGLAPTVSADSPVWISPFTLTVTGAFTVA